MRINQAEALGFPTVVAFDAGNLSAVAEALHAKLPDKPVIILGDNDRYQEITQGTNPGKSKAQEAALARIKPYTDFNDLATRSRLGREGVERQVRATVNKAVAEVKQKQQQGQQQAYQQQQKQRRIRHAAHI